MPSSKKDQTEKKTRARRKTTTTSHLSPDAPKTLGLREVFTELGLDHAAAGSMQRLKKRSLVTLPPALLDTLRDQLRAQMEHNASAAIRRSSIFPLTTLKQYDFDYPEELDKEAVMQAASLESLEN